MTDTYLGVDVGGGGVRVALDAVGCRLEAAESAAVPRRNGWIDIESLGKRIGLLVSTVFPEKEGIRGMAVGLTGMPELLDVPSFLNVLKLEFPASQIAVTSDAITTHLGALEGKAGTVISVGTGTVAFGTDYQHIHRRGDGWGHLLGDGGSGAWIGRSGIRAALRALDGNSQGSEALLKAGKELFGGIDELVERVYGSDSPAHELASFAPLVATVAREGDPVAQSIWTQAGELLAQTAYATSAGLPPIYSWAGSLFNAGELILDPFTGELSRLAPESQVFAPVGDATDGALRLARLGLGYPELISDMVAFGGARDFALKAPSVE